MSEWKMVPKSALRWLFGEEGMFECPPNKYFRGKPAPYWWRSVFREMIEAAPTPPAEPPEDVAGLTPVAWAALNNGRTGIARFDGRMIVSDAKNEHHPDPLYSASALARLAAERDALREAAKQWERLAVKWPEATGLPAPANEEESLRAWLATAGGKTLNDLLNLMRERLVLVTRAELNRAALRPREGGDMTDIERLARAAGVEATPFVTILEKGVARLVEERDPYLDFATTKLYSTESVAAIVAQARKEALEEAAQIADDVPVHWEHWQTAAAIRAMK